VALNARHAYRTPASNVALGIVMARQHGAVAEHVLGV
jgi:hypothetical protein